MRKNFLRFAASCMVIGVVVALLLVRLNEVLVTKSNNRYYMLEQTLSELDEDYEVQIYGSCHAYTSFDAGYFEQTYGLTAFVMANPSEIIPTTYLRMAERFKTDAPKVAVVEEWGLNAHETYISEWDIFEFYMPVNVELLPFSLRKMEVISDYDSLSKTNDNFAVVKYKDRIMEGELTELDFNYSFDGACMASSDYICDEMNRRVANNGYKNWPAEAEGTLSLADYNERQAVVGDDEVLEPEEDIVKYVDKIIDLCKEYGVELIFYRAPYVSTENELKKAKWFAQYCEEKGVLYLDTEKKIEWETVYDFGDYQHLNENGARKVTDYLAPYILSAAQ